MRADFDRQVFCLAGLPFDAMDMPDAVARVREAAVLRKPCFMSTPNLNFLIGCLGDPEFRDSVIHSDMSIMDGMPLVWMARLLGIPIRERVAGSGLFEALWRDGSHGRNLSIYFFGGPDGVAEQACRMLNTPPSGLRCVGFECPGFGTVEAMSGEETISRINASGADFLVVALGARKGQAWIERNRSRITVPLISHLGAVVNFVAGTVSRAPLWMQRAGLEWAWRIKEEPALWRRYALDGVALIRLLLTRVLPYALWLRLRRGRFKSGKFLVERELADENDVVRLVVSGVAPDALPDTVRDTFHDAATARKPVTIDLAQAEYLSPAFFGLMLVLKKHQDAHGARLRFEGISPGMRRFFFWSGVDYLLADVITK
jgi:N-acetylglucosaminyldiphosphoundecaprenol N-acetyl-beta-D-mannosaminyltransferase